jgi:DNA invertase Pin-like site-specific DNA recombinase
MRDTRRGLFDVVMVFRFDRMGRSVQHLIGVLEEFRSLGVEFISLHEAVDTSTSTGRLVYGVIALIAAFERELIVERVCSGLARAKRMGKVLGRPKRDDIDLARVKRLLAHGTPVAEIARMLDLPRSTIRSALKRAGEKPAPKTPPPDVVNA